MPLPPTHAIPPGIRRALVCGAGGFLGGHAVRRLKAEGWWVRGADARPWPYGASPADEYVVADLRDPVACAALFDQPFDEVYHLAADMGGAGFIFTGEHDAEILQANARITLNLVDLAARHQAGRFLYPSSACVYPQEHQEDADAPLTREDSAYPAHPDSDYGWEKLFGERLCLAAHRNQGLDVRIVRLHNVFGPEGAWRGGREKAPAALCRKVAEAAPGGHIEVWGDGEQTRSFLYVDEAMEGLRRIMDGDFIGPVNLGSEEKVALNELARMIIDISGKDLALRHVPGPQGVRGRTSDNTLLREKLGWAPTMPLRVGLERTYAWISKQVAEGA